MPTVYDVPPAKLIEQLSNYLKRIPQIQPPQWSYYVKTGSQASRPPMNRDWWYSRSASILRKLYLHGPLGIHDLEVAYGGRKESGYGLAHERPAGSSSIRKCLAQLQAAGLVQKTPKGRILTPEGRRVCDRISTEVFKEIAKTQPELLKIIT